MKIIVSFCLGDTMRYDALIKYKGNELKIKVQQKALGSTFTLPDFIKTVRLENNKTIEYVHFLLDWPTKDICDYEEGVQDIPQKFLSLFAYHFHLPQKLKHLGIIEEQENKKKLIARLKQLRLENETPQVFVAAELGIARSTYACYEAGKNDPDIYILWKLADIYGISLDSLVGRDYKEKEKQLDE